MPTSWSEKSFSHGFSSDSDSSGLIQAKENSFGSLSIAKKAWRLSQTSFWKPFFQLFVTSWSYVNSLFYFVHEQNKIW